MARVCTGCGYTEKSAGPTRCRICGTLLPPAAPSPVPAGGGPPHVPGPFAGPGRVHPAPPAPGPSPAARPVPAPVPSSDPNILEGRITLVQRHDEPPRPNVCRSLSKFMLIVILFPIYAVAFLFSLTAYVMLAFMRWNLIAQLFNPFTWTGLLLNLFEVLVLRGRWSPTTCVMFRGEVMDDFGQPGAFTFLGPLEGGNLVEGHRVRLEGKWQNGRAGAGLRGTFEVEEGVDLDTGSRITSAFRNPWPVVLVVLILVFLGLYGLPMLVQSPH